MTTASNGHAIEVLQAKLDALTMLVNERHDRYAERHEANNERVAAAFAAAEAAAANTEAALKEYKIGANEWRDTVKDLIANLRESRSGGLGKEEGLAEARARHQEALAAARLTQRTMLGLGVTVVVAIILQLLRGG